MPISNQIPSSRLIQPGVVESAATRPASPFEGQCIFQKDTDQLLVWNGTAWVIPNQTTQNFGGLELVKTQTVGSGVSSVAVADAFSAIYDNYKITYTGGASSAATVINLSLTGSTNSHYAIMLYNGYGGGGSVVASNNRANWTHAGGGVGLVPNMNVELQNPFLAKQTFMMGNYSDVTNTGMITGFQGQAVSFSGFTIAPDSGTFTGGTLAVYGYRK